MRIAIAPLLALLLALAAAASAFAADMSDDDYVTKAFGCSAVFTTAKQVVDPNQGWWGDKLPPELSSNPGYLVGVVNAQRKAKSIKPMLNPNEPVISLGYEEQVANGWSYFIDFAGMRKSEVQEVIEILGGIDKLVPGATLSFRPLSTHSYYASAVDGSISLSVGNQDLTFNISSPVGDIRSKVTAAFKSSFGSDVPFDIYITLYSYNNGTSGGDVSIYADMSGATLSGSEYTGEGGI